MHIGELDTPAVIIDLDVMEQNLARMGGYCRKQGIHLRPHTKTHKIPELARRQIANGAVGVTVAKLGEAEVMAEAGLTDILVAYPIVDHRKASQLCRLAERAVMTIALDSKEAAQALSQKASEHGVAIGVFVEVDVGLERCGLANEQEAVALARNIVDLNGLQFRGLLFYPGQVLVNLRQRNKLIEEVNVRLDRTLEAFQKAGIAVTSVSGGSTATAYQSHAFHGVTEIRPGTYIFNDRNTLEVGEAHLDDCAVWVIVTVVSTAVAGRAIVDGGSKTFSSDRLLTGDCRGFGLIKEDPEAVLETMSEEHGHLNVANTTRSYHVGERLTILPNHVCTTINMHDEIFGVRGCEVEVVWPVGARGKVR